MKILAFESSAKAASTALLSDGLLLAEYTQNSGQTHSRTLMQMAKNMLTSCDLTPQDIGAVAVAAGPGSFTGVRIGMACAKGFADMQADPEEALAILLANQNAENFPLSETVERKSMQTLLPLMETKDVSFLAQSEEMWQNNIDWLYTQGLIEQKPSVSDVMAVLG